MNNLPQKIAIIGVGLIGGSIACGLKKRLGTKITILGACNSLKRAKLAKSYELIDVVINDIQDITTDTQLIILAVPVQTSIEILAKLAKKKQKLLIMDIGSTKEKICEFAVNNLPENINFIGTHPMAGKETSGFEEADPNLFVGKPWIICPPKNTPLQSIAIVENLIELLRAKPVIMQDKNHDRLAAWASHLFLTISSILIAATHKQPQWQKLERIASTGFRDTTRLASQDPKMKTDIILTNRKNILMTLGKLKKEIDDFSELLLRNNNKEIFAYFDQTKKIRDRWLKTYSS